MELELVFSGLDIFLLDYFKPKSGVVIYLFFGTCSSLPVLCKSTLIDLADGREEDKEGNI